MRRFRDWRRHYEKRLERERAVAEQLAREPGQAEQREEQEPTDDEDYQGDEGAEPGEMTTASGGPTNSQLSGGGVHPSLAVSKRSFASSKFEAPKSSSQSTAVSKSVRSMIAGVYMDWPRPPRDSSSTGQVNCPYCFDLLDEGEIRSKTRWRKHLKKDLEPYSCLYTECGTKLLKMFDSEAKWVSHIQVAHSPGGTWVCRMMPHKHSNLNSNDPGAGVVLNTEDDFKQHLQTEHEGMYPKSKIDTMAKAAFRPHQTRVADMFRDECPMRCPASMETSPEKAIVLGASHVANHLLLLALEALPERSVRSSESELMDDDDDDDDGSDNKNPPKAEKKNVRGTIRDELEELPHLDYGDDSSSLWTNEEGIEGSEEIPPPPPAHGAPQQLIKSEGTQQLAPGARLRYYGYLPVIKRQHRKLDDVSQLKDPTMEKFIRKQKGVEDLSLRLALAVRGRALRRWRMIRSVIWFVLRTTPQFQAEDDAAGEAETEQTTASAGGPALYVQRDKKFGSPGFEQLDPLAKDVRTIRGNIGRMLVDCNLQAKKGRWGVLGPLRVPAAILYMDFCIHEPVDERIKRFRISMSLSEDSPDTSSKITADTAGGTPKEHTTYVTRFTPFYGPKRMRKELGSIAETRGSDTMAPGTAGFGAGTARIYDGRGVEQSDLFPTTGSYLVATSQLCSRENSLDKRDTLIWDIRRFDLESSASSHDNNSSQDMAAGSLNDTIIRVAFAIEHNAREFCLKIEISNMAAKIHRRLRLNFGSQNQDAGATMFRFENLENYLASNRQRLDDLAEGLNKSMEMANAEGFETMPPLPRSEFHVAQEQPELSFLARKDQISPLLRPKSSGLTPVRGTGGNGDDDHHSELEESDEEYFTGREDEGE